MKQKDEIVVNYLSATARSLSGRKVPSVSMYIALPSPPPWSMGSWGQKETILSTFMNSSAKKTKNKTAGTLLPQETLPDKWQQACGTTGSFLSETLQTSQWWSPSQSHLRGNKHQNETSSPFLMMMPLTPNNHQATRGWTAGNQAEFWGTWGQLETHPGGACPAPWSP